MKDKKEPYKVVLIYLVNAENIADAVTEARRRCHSSEESELHVEQL